MSGCRACQVRETPPPRADAAYLAALADEALGIDANLCSFHQDKLDLMCAAGKDMLAERSRGDSS